MTATTTLAKPRPREFRYADAPVETLTAAWIDAEAARLWERMEAAGSDASAWIEAVHHYDEISSHVGTHNSRVNLRFRQDATDEAAASEQRRFSQEIHPAVSRLDDRTAELLLESPCLDALRANFGEVFVADLEQTRISSAPVNAELRTRVDETLMRHTEIFGNLTIRWRGEDHPWPFLRKALDDSDRSERHAAFASAVERLRGVEDELQSIFDEIQVARFAMADNLGMGFVELAYTNMGRLDWTPDDARSFREGVMEHIVPLVEQLHRAQAAQHGTELLHPADAWLYPQEPDLEPAVGVDEQIPATAHALAPLGDELAEPFRLLAAIDHIDLAARPGKGPGAFCTTFPDEGLPFVFCNSVDSVEDLRTLLHEYGHALQAWHSRDIVPVWQRWPTAEAAEIHSMSMEMLAAPHMAGLVGEDRLSDYLLRQVRHSIGHLPYMAAVDEFQHALYDSARTAPTTAAERGQLWKAIAARYMPGMDWHADEWWKENRWLTQLHIFHYPFYYLDYALAQIVAWQVWTLSLDDLDEGLATYLRLCQAGGTKPFRQLVTDAGLDDPFAPATIASAVARLQRQVPLT